MHEYNTNKATHLYNTLDNSEGFYTYKMRKEYRSIMNVPFCLPTKDLEEQFIREAEKKGLIGLRGHPSVGNCRASLYNGMTMEGVQTLVSFMQYFKKRN